jgi:trigger factor
MFGAAVSQDVAHDMMQRNFVEAIVAEKLNPAGAPSFEPTPVKAGEDFQFSATFEVYPEFEVAGLDEIEIEKPVAEVTDADVDNMIETLRKQQATWEEVEREAALQDRVNIDFTGTVDGEEFPGGKAEGFDLELGSGRMIDGFEDGILGKKAGEEFTIEVTFPEEYHAEELKGKPAQFVIKLNKIQQRILPEVTADFVKLFGVEDGELDSLKAEVRKNMERELSQTLKNRVKEQALNALIEKNPVEVPAALIDQEVDVLRRQAVQRFGGDASKMPELPAELFKDEAERRVRIGLVLGEVIKQADLKVDEVRVNALIDNAAAAYEDPQEVVDYYKNNQQLMDNMRNVAMEEQAIELVVEKAKVTEKQVAFDEIMNNQAAG